jgi:lipopolysaccharide transport system permease protein
MSEAITSGAASIRQNIHLVKNVMLPIDLIPIRAVLVSMVGEVVSIFLVMLLLIWNHDLGWCILLLPIVIFLQLLFLIGCVLILSALVVALPDLINFINLTMLLLMFISPIGFKPEMVPENFMALIYLNPVYYMTEAFRSAMIASHNIDWIALVIYISICCSTYIVGCAFFKRFKNVLVDYE